jgi:hypothetical protein
MKTPLEQCYEVIDALDAIQEQLEVRRKKAYARLYKAQKTCPHKRWEKGALLDKCLDCGLDNY